MVWSFSRLSAFHQCPYGFWLKYMQCNEGSPNFFGQYGSFIHSILEKYERGELSIFEISQFYIDNFNNYITCDAPNNKYVSIRDTYFDKGLNYLDNIDLVLDKYFILGIEKEVKFNIGKYEMIGYIDLLLEDKITHDITILDHKSASIKFKKNGDVSKSDLGHVLNFKRQLYLYSLSVFDEYGKYPKYLEWNLFKDCNKLNVEFDIEEFNQAIKWAEDTVGQIENETLWLPNPSQFFCYNICDMRFCACEYKPQ